MSNRDNPLYETALHEAAHAVVAHVSGLDVQRITIIPTSDVAGCCFVNFTTSVKLDKTEKAAIYLAGSMAEYRLFGRAPGSSSDLTQVYELTKGTRHYATDGSYIEETSRAYNGAVKLCNRLLTAHWDVIDGLALTLIDYPTLAGPADIYDIIAIIAKIVSRKTA